MSAKFEGPIFEDNERREAAHKGEEHACGRCDSPGLVGDSIKAAYTVLTDGRGFPWWICQSCIEKQFP